MCLKTNHTPKSIHHSFIYLVLNCFSSYSRLNESVTWLNAQMQLSEKKEKKILMCLRNIRGLGTFFRPIIIKYNNERSV